jgi:hypothetical protein
MTIIRNITATAKLSGQGIEAGKTYQIVKMQTREVAGFGVSSSAWVIIPNGPALTVKNEHLVFEV